jgi:hypothetical protein
MSAKRRVKAKGLKRKALQTPVDYLDDETPLVQRRTESAAKKNKPTPPLLSSDERCKAVAEFVVYLCDKAKWYRAVGDAEAKEITGTQSLSERKFSAFGVCSEIVNAAKECGVDIGPEPQTSPDLVRGPEVSVPS